MTDPFNVSTQKKVRFLTPIKGINDLEGNQRNSCHSNHCTCLWVNFQSTIFFWLYTSSDNCNAEHAIVHRHYETTEPTTTDSTYINKTTKYLYWLLPTMCFIFIVVISILYCTRLQSPFLPQTGKPHKSKLFVSNQLN